MSRSRLLQYVRFSRLNRLSPVVIRAVRAFAWTALAIGFGMVVWILYAMLFSYR